MKLGLVANYQHINTVQLNELTNSNNFTSSELNFNQLSPMAQSFRNHPSFNSPLANYTNFMNNDYKPFVYQHAQQAFLPSYTYKNSIAPITEINTTNSTPITTNNNNNNNNDANKNILSNKDMVALEEETSKISVSQDEFVLNNKESSTEPLPIPSTSSDENKTISNKNEPDTSVESSVEVLLNVNLKEPPTLAALKTDDVENPDNSKTTTTTTTIEVEKNERPSLNVFVPTNFAKHQFFNYF